MSFGSLSKRFETDLGEESSPSRKRTACGMTLSSVTIQITPESKPALPGWMGEVAAFAQVLTQTGMLKTIQEQVRFARARFGQYDLIDFVAVLIGYMLSGEPTLLAFYERLAPWAEPFMALFGRDQLPHRSTLSRFLAVSIRIRWRPCAPAFTRRFWPASRFLLPAVWLIGLLGSGW